MSAIPNPRFSASNAATADKSPRLRVHRPRLNYGAALRAHLHGGCAARVAIAAGSTARSRRSLRRVGLKIVHSLKNRYDVVDAFDALSVTIETLCLKIKELLNATKRRQRFYRGRWVMGPRVPDWRMRARGCQLYMKAVGLKDWPL